MPEDGKLKPQLKRAPTRLVLPRLFADDPLGFLKRLMGYVSLARNTRLGGEDVIQVQVATMLRQWSLSGRLRAVWSHPANELATRGRAAAVARAGGLITGTPDLLFIGASGGCAIEIKTATGSMSPEQRDFRDWCAHVGTPWFKCRSLAEVEAALVQVGLLI